MVINLFLGMAVGKEEGIQNCFLLSCVIQIDCNWAFCVNESGKVFFFDCVSPLIEEMAKSLVERPQEDFSEMSFVVRMLFGSEV